MEEFEYDPTKSAANRDKHGIDFVEAEELWSVVGVTKRLPFPLEDRFMRTARLWERYWVAIFTPRGERLRLISVRRARDEEIAEYERVTAEAGSAGEHDHEP